MLVFSVLEILGLIFLAQIYCLFLFDFDCKNKCFDVVYKCFDVVYKFFDVVYKCKINKSKFLFLWFLFLTIKRWLKKGIWKWRVFLLWDRTKVRQTNQFITTETISCSSKWRHQAITWAKQTYAISDKGGDYMISVSRDEILSRFAGIPAVL